MRRDPLEIRSYDPAWVPSFRRERARLQAALSPWLTAPIEHIGSTSIWRMPAKPIVDMLALVADHPTFADALPRLSSLGWLPAPEPGDRQHRRWSVCFPSVEHRTHHLHVVEAASSAWPDWLLFRDYLCGHPAAAGRYAELKRRLVEIDDTDRDRYRAAKAPLIRELMLEAHAWAAGS